MSFVDHDTLGGESAQSRGTRAAPGASNADDTPSADSPRSADNTADPDATKALGVGRTSDNDAVSMLLETQRAPGRGGRDALLEAYNRVAPLRRVVEQIAESIAEVDWTLKDDGDEVDDHPFLDWLGRPNSEMSGYQYRKLVAEYLLLVGEHFDLVDTADTRPDASNARPVETLPVTPTDIDRREGSWHVDHNQFRGRVSDDRLIWLKEIDITDPYGRGVGIGRVLQDEIEISEYAARHEKMEFANNAVPAFLLFMPGAQKSDAERFETNWRNKLRGPDKTGKGAFFGAPEGAKPQFEQVSRKLADMDVSELRKFSERVMQRVFGVPPEVLGEVQDSNRATIENAQQLYTRNTLAPKLRFLRDEWSQKLLPLFPDTEGLELTFEDPDPENTALLADLMKEHEWAFTGNEVRTLGDQDPRPDRDVYLQPADAPNAKVEIEDAEPPESEGGASGAVPGGTADAAQSTEGDSQQKAGGAELPDDAVIEVDFSGSRKQPDDPVDEATRIAEALQPEFIESETVGVFEDQAREWIERTSREVGVEPRFDLLNPFVRDFVDQYGAEDVRQVTETTRDHIAYVVDQGVKQGKNPRDITDELEGVLVEGREPALPENFPFPTIGDRAEAISRTEMLRASNFGTFQAHRVSGVVDRREWMATPDTRVRAEHAQLGGVGGGSPQIVGIDEPFEIGGLQAMYPGGFGVARLDIMCRCTTGAVIGERAFRDMPTLPEHARVAVATDDGLRRKGEVKDIWSKAFDEPLEASERQYEAVLTDTFHKAFTDHILPAASETFGVAQEELAS